MESLLRYGIMHYGGTFTTVLAPLIMAQRFCLKTVFFVRKFERMSYLFTEHKILTFHQLYKQTVVSHGFKYYSNYAVKVFTRNTRASTYITLEIENYLKESSRNQFCYKGKSIFNKMVQHFGNSILQEKKPKFKMKVRAALLNNEL